MEKRPKYEYIMNNLIAGINSGKYLPGSELPSETELTELYEVSRITARRAIDELYRAGYIEKKQGKRGCVREPAKIQELTAISSYTEEILRLGMTPSRKVISSELRLCNLEEQQNLKLDKADPIFYLERIIYADNKPLCYTAATLPYNNFRDIESLDFTELSLYEIIERKYNVKILNSILKLRAVLPDQEIARYLDVEKTMPLLYSSAVTYGMFQEVKLPIEMFKTYYLTDRFEYRLTQQRYTTLG